MHPEYWARVDSDKSAVIVGGTGEVVTYGELAARSAQLARYLRETGLQRGDHVALVLENHPRFFEVVWAALQAGLYLTTINSHLTSEEVGYIVGDCEAKAVVSSSALAHVVTELDWEGLPLVASRLMVDGARGGFGDYDEAISTFPSTPLDSGDAGTFMLYTSGTTGRPKGVLRPLPAAGLDDPPDGVRRIGAMWGFDEATVYLSPAPLYHSAPLVYTTTVQRFGGTVILMEKFDASAALTLIEAHRVTHSQWVPTMFVRMLALPEEERSAFDLSSQRVAVHAAAPCPPDVKRQMIDWWGPILSEYYAGTEGGGLTMINSAEWLEHPGSVGRGNVQILDDDGQVLPPGEVGTVYFVGEGGYEYKGDPAKTAACRLPGLTTMGDCGYLDEDGWLYLTDRKDFMIISGGVNIYPREAEDVLVSHPLVLDVGVFGVPNPDFGEEVKAAVQLANGVKASDELAEELVAFCRSRIAAYKSPRSIDFVEELPRTPAGKLIKRHLRDRYWETEEHLRPSDQ